MGFISMLGNVKVLTLSISAVVVFTLMLVTVSTMNMAIRERFRELAILKALGYRRRDLFSFILAESFGVSPRWGRWWGSEAHGALGPSWTCSASPMDSWVL